MTTASANNEPGTLEIFDSSARPSPPIEELRDLYRFRDLVAQWCARNLKLRYKRSALGILWTLGEPLLLMAILALVFSQAFRFPIENFPLYLLSGLLVFDFFSRSTVQIIDETLASSRLTRRIHVPRSAFAVATIFSLLVNWAVALIPLAALMVALGAGFSPALLSLPFALLLTSLFALGIGLLVATLGAYFQDIRITYQVLLTGLFYATPIFYPIEIVPTQVAKFLVFNPLLHFVELFRVPIYQGLWPSLQTWLACSGFAATSAIFGWLVFTISRDSLSRHS